MRRPRRPRERGVALLLVLWIFMILGVLALDFARYMRDDAMATINLADETRGYYLALAGMNRAIFDAEQFRENQDPATRRSGTNEPGLDLDAEPLVHCDGNPVEQEFAGGRWRVRMWDEAARISLNRAQPALLTRIVSNLLQGGNPVQGIDRRMQKQIDTVVSSIIDWRDRNSMTSLNGAESDYYLKRRVPYRAKNGFFDAPEELLMVRGVTPALFYGGNGVPGLRDVFSVYARGTQLHVDRSPPAVLQALLGTDVAADLLEKVGEGVPIVEQVKAQLLAVDPGLAEGDYIAEGGECRIVRIEAQGDISQPRNQSHVTAIVDLASDTADGTRIIRWLDRSPWEGPLPIPGANGADEEEG